MDGEIALEIVQELRSEYEENTAIGDEIEREVIHDRSQDSFEVLGTWVPVPYDWIVGESLSELTRTNLSSLVSGLYQGERRFLMDRLDEADNVPTVSLSEFSHNELIQALTEVYNPTQLYVPQSEPFLDIEFRKAIRSVVDTLSNLEESSVNINGQEDTEKACYAFRGDYIRMNQSTRLPLDRTEWLPDRTFDINGDISEHPLYCAYGASNEADTDYILAVASILSKNPTIRDNGAVKIVLED